MKKFKLTYRIVGEKIVNSQEEALEMKKALEQNEVYSDVKLFEIEEKEKEL